MRGGRLTFSRQCKEIEDTRQAVGSPDAAIFMPKWGPGWLELDGESAPRYRRRSLTGIWPASAQEADYVKPTVAAGRGGAGVGVGVRLPVVLRPVLRAGVRTLWAHVPESRVRAGVSAGVCAGGGGVLSAHACGGDVLSVNVT